MNTNVTTNVTGTPGLQTGKAGFVIHQENDLTSSPSAMHFMCSKKPNEKILFCGM